MSPFSHVPQWQKPVDHQCNGHGVSGCATTSIISRKWQLHEVGFNCSLVNESKRAVHVCWTNQFNVVFVLRSPGFSITSWFATHSCRPVLMAGCWRQCPFRNPLYMNVQGLPIWKSNRWAKNINSPGWHTAPTKCKICAVIYTKWTSNLEAKNECFLSVFCNIALDRRKRWRPLYIAHTQTFIRTHKHTHTCTHLNTYTDHQQIRFDHSNKCPRWVIVTYPFYW